MPADNTALDASLAAMQTQITRATTVGASAVAALKGQGAAIKAALDADNTIDQANTDKAKAIVDQVVAQSTADIDALQAAVLANTPPVEPPVEP